MDTHQEKNKPNPFVLTALILSFLLGALSFFLIDQRTAVNPDRVLDHVKRDFRLDGPIKGSWIEMTKVPWSKYSYQTDVYYGGLSRLEDGQSKHYEFIADAYSGNIMDIYEI